PDRAVTVAHGQRGRTGRAEGLVPGDDGEDPIPDLGRGAGGRRGGDGRGRADVARFGGSRRRTPFRRVHRWRSATSAGTTTTRRSPSRWRTTSTRSARSSAPSTPWPRPAPTAGARSSGTGSSGTAQFSAVPTAPSTPGSSDSRTAPERAGGDGHDPQTQVRRVPALLAKGRPEDRETPQPRDVRHPRSGRAARAGGPVLQAPALTRRGRVCPAPGALPCGRVTSPSPACLPSGMSPAPAP